jgi:N-acetylneuraminate lyase
MKINKFEGLIAAPFTPMNIDGSLNTGRIPEYYNLLKNNGVIGAFINGSNGEGASLTLKEKQINAAKWAECYKQDGKVRIINLIGGTSYQECIENAIFSKESGLSALAILTPYYFKPDVTRLAEFVAIIGEAVPDMPVYLYHIPELTGVYLPIASVMEKLSEMLSNFTGIKYTHLDLMDYMSCLNFKNGKYDVLWGRDECLLSALATGAKGAVGGTYSYSAPLYYDLMKAFNEGNMNKARMLQQKSIEMIKLLGKYGGIATGKVFMRYLGIDCGKFRLPVRNMDDELYGEFQDDVRGLDMEEYFSKK